MSVIILDNPFIEFKSSTSPFLMKKAVNTNLRLFQKPNIQQD